MQGSFVGIINSFFPSNLLELCSNSINMRNSKRNSSKDLTVFCGLRGPALKGVSSSLSTAQLGIHLIICCSILSSLDQEMSLTGELGQLYTLSFQGQLPPALDLFYQRSRTYPSNRIYLSSEGECTGIWRFLKAGDWGV